jgi:hypothetical protein
MPEQNLFIPVHWFNRFVNETYMSEIPELLRLGRYVHVRYVHMKISSSIGGNVQLSLQSITANLYFIVISKFIFPSTSKLKTVSD